MSKETETWSPECELGTAMSCSELLSSPHMRLERTCSPLTGFSSSYIPQKPQNWTVLDVNRLHKWPLRAPWTRARRGLRSSAKSWSSSVSDAFDLYLIPLCESSGRFDPLTETESKHVGYEGVWGRGLRWWPY